jgi:hypothetical protein
VLFLADGSQWIDPPTYADGSGCDRLGNRHHITGPPSPEVLKRYGADELYELYGYGLVN